ncbi:MAG: hypothetical protein IPM46_09140 [Flavobacteriales bacterium]|nr:hypothetical protein [Flavobacteriales bacterium]
MTPFTTLIHEYAAYDQWANARFIERLSGEDAAILDAPTPSSFPTLRRTLLHIRDAEHAWTCRLLSAPTTWPAEESISLGSVMGYVNRFHDMVHGYGEAELLAGRSYQDLKGRTHASAVWRMIMHCLNHSTQHRGQLITMMRALDLQDIPANDLVVFQRLSIQR